MKTALVLALAATLAFAQGTKDTKKAPVKAEPAKAEPAKTAIQPGAAATGFVGNKDSKVLHKADCKTAAKMKPANKVSFATKAEAEKAGYKACKVCKP